jgi:hypothetical protein
MILMQECAQWLVSYSEEPSAAWKQQVSITAVRSNILMEEKQLDSAVHDDTASRQALVSNLFCVL